MNTNSRNEPNYRDRFEVSCGWIDKIPLAQFVNPVNDINGNSIKGKMELGDLLLIYSHNRINAISKEFKNQSVENRAAIVQAKIASKVNPEIPIGKISKGRASSISKELALLSSWPKFDLYQTSRSKTPILTNIQLDSKKSNAKFAGFFLKQWFVGNPIHKSVCNESLGSLIINLKTGREGQDFDTTGTSDWDNLIKTLIDTCGKYKLPNFIFSGSAWSRFFNIPRKPLILYFYFGKNIFTRTRFPIIVINRIVQEGEL